MKRIICAKCGSLLQFDPPMIDDQPGTMAKVHPCRKCSIIVYDDDLPRVLGERQTHRNQDSEQ